MQGLVDRSLDKNLVKKDYVEGGPESNTAGVLKREMRNLDTQTDIQREVNEGQGGHVTGTMHLQDKEHQGLLANTRS